MHKSFLFAAIFILSLFNASASWEQFQNNGFNNNNSDSHSWKRQFDPRITSNLVHCESDLLSPIEISELNKLAKSFKNAEPIFIILE